MAILILISCYILLGICSYCAIYSYGKYNYHKGKAEVYGQVAKDLEDLQKKWADEFVSATAPKNPQARA